MTEKALALIVNDVTKWRSQGQNPVEILEQSVRKGYTDVYQVTQTGTQISLLAPQADGADFKTWVWRLEAFHQGKADDGTGATPLGYWRPNWGPTPAQEGCKAPPEAQKEFARRHGPRLAQA